MLGVNGVASIHGSLFTNNETFYGFSNSHSTLLLIHNNTDYEIMLQRNMNNQDKRGIAEPMKDDFLTTFE
jgi:hypothetical protein